MRILIVDDSSTVRMILRSSLTAGGCEVLEATDGTEALTILDQRQHVDVVILDRNMPGMNGLECLRRIRERPALKSVRIIMLTTEAGRNEVAAAIRAGLDGYLLKPVTADAIHAEIARVSGVRPCCIPTTAHSAEGAD